MKPGAIATKIVIPQDIPVKDKREWMERNQAKSLSIMRTAPYYMKGKTDGRRKEAEEES